jgi:peptidoglycan/xylan/chitin deacetylase (PgdA/CDA1 family)
MVVLGILGSAACSDPELESSSDDFTEKQLTGRSLPAKTVALTFDDGPGVRTKELSGYLKEQGITAGFFMLGNAATGKADVMRQVDADGHVIGNHTFDHKLLTSAGADPLSEIRKTDAILAPFFTGNMHMFRAPYGGWSPAIADSLNRTDLAHYVGSIFWDVGGVLTETHAADWDCWGHGTSASPHEPLSIQDCGNRYIQELHDRGDRGVVLMHDIHSNTVDMVKYIVPKLKADGFKFARIDAVPDINDQLKQNGATPGPIARAMSTPLPPIQASECGDERDTPSFSVCGHDVGKDEGSLFNCSNHRLTLACKCQSDCVVAARGASCECDGGEPGVP